MEIKRWLSSKMSKRLKVAAGLALAGLLLVNFSKTWATFVVADVLVVVAAGLTVIDYRAWRARDRAESVSAPEQPADSH